MLWRNVSKMKRLHSDHFDIVPFTYLFPDDYKKWQIDRENEKKNALYILKPANASCGKGI